MNSKHLIGLAQSLRAVARSKDVERRATVCNAAANALEQLAREQNTEKDDERPLVTVTFPPSARPRRPPVQRPAFFNSTWQELERAQREMLTQAELAYVHWDSGASNAVAAPPPVPMQWDEDVVHDAPVPGIARIEVDEAAGNIRVTSTTDNTGVATVWNIARNGPESFEGTVTTSQNEDEAPIPFLVRWLAENDDTA